ncbi:MAG: winged helix-turn-helix transcriptional regulator [Flavobacteriales bacterium]|nr:winged helix-turn-helix transcriptional regulator [Flavobacteriales bacterium]
MENDFIKELGYLGFATRLKRLSDMLLQDGRRMYQNLDVDIEPNWYLIFKLLSKHKQLGVTEIAQHLQLAHPSIITITNKMEKAGYLLSIRSKADSRKRVLSLSEKAIDKLPEYEIIWQAGIKSVKDALDDLNILNTLDELEKRFSKSGFQSRTLEQLNKN